MANASTAKLNTEEAGKIAKVNRGTIVQWIKRGILRATDVGEGELRPRWEIDERDLLTAMEVRKTLGRTRKPKETTVEVFDIVAEEEVKEDVAPVSANDSYIRELLEENRQLRIEIDQLRAKHNKLVEDLLEVLVSNEN